MIEYWTIYGKSESRAKASHNCPSLSKGHTRRYDEARRCRRLEASNLQASRSGHVELQLQGGVTEIPDGFPSQNSLDTLDDEHAQRTRTFGAGVEMFEPRDLESRVASLSFVSWVSTDVAWLTGFGGPVRRWNDVGHFSRDGSARSRERVVWFNDHTRRVSRHGRSRGRRSDSEKVKCEPISNIPLTPPTDNGFVLQRFYPCFLSFRFPILFI